jgi:hypothetical protein
VSEESNEIKFGAANHDNDDDDDDNEPFEESIKSSIKQDVKISIFNSYIELGIHNSS